MNNLTLTRASRSAPIGLSISLMFLNGRAGMGQDAAVKLSDQRSRMPSVHLLHALHGPANMLEMIRQDAALKGFAELLQITGLQDYVKTAPITVFAPVDPACMPLLKQARMWRDQKNRRKLAALSTSVKHHLLAGKYMWRPGSQNDVKQLQGDTLEMVSGFRLAVYPTSSGASLTIQVSNSRRARVVKQDIVTSNGILFVIDRPLDAHSVNID